MCSKTPEQKHNLHLLQKVLHYVELSDDGTCELLLTLHIAEREDYYNFYSLECVSIFFLGDLQNQVFCDFHHAPQMINGRPLTLRPCCFTKILAAYVET